METIDQATVTSALRDLMVGHGLTCVMEQEWIIPNNQLPAIRALWHPREDFGHLDVQVLLSKGRIIEECFAGIGAGKAGFGDGLHNFMVNSLHVLLSSLWGMSCHEEQIQNEQWTVGGRQFTACIGNIGTRASAGLQVRDNEPWESGIAGLKGIAWPQADGYYSFRNFIVLRSASEQEASRFAKAKSIGSRLLRAVGLGKQAVACRPLCEHDRLRQQGLPRCLGL